MAMLIGLSTGSVFGYGRGVVASQSYQEFERLGATAALGSFAHLQYEYADLKHAREGLLMYSALLEELESTKPDRTNKIDLTFTYARLALLEDSVNEPVQSRTYMAKAAYWYKASGGRAYSDDQLKSMVNALDKHLQQ